MTQRYGGTRPPPEETTAARSTADVAREQARSVEQDAKGAGRHVADVAMEETKSVAGDAKNQARDLWSQTRAELVGQSGQQQKRVAGGLRSLGDELSSMAQTSQQAGLATDLAGRAAEQARRAADYLDGRDPGSLLDELKGFARRRPGTFLAVAAGLGVLGGRLSRSLMPEHEEQRRGPTASGTMSTTGMAADQMTDLSAARATTSRTPYTGVQPTATDAAGTPIDPSRGPLTDPETGGVVDPLASVDPRTGRERTNAGRDTDALGGDVDR